MSAVKPGMFGNKSSSLILVVALANFCFLLAAGTTSHNLPHDRGVSPPICTALAIRLQADLLPLPPAVNSRVFTDQSYGQQFRVRRRLLAIMLLLLIRNFACRGIILAAR